MTRPSEIKVREGATPGTPYAAFEEGRQLTGVRFDITPDLIQEYIRAVDADASLYQLDGRAVAPPGMIFPYMTAVLYKDYPPIQGIVMGEVELEWHAPVWADETTPVRANGAIVRKFHKKGRGYVQWKAQFHDADGRLLWELVNTFHVPE
ncbi:MaoC family dehydratase [Alcaligenaceae bacterium]|nr:MaoC family dehydratase [Alcaligenaceae bacterium]